jgi:YegS/Rv2252/BmrU family lipid kinase
MIRARMPGAFVIVNPVAAAGAARRRWPGLARGLARVLPGFETAFSEGPGHAVELARRAQASGHELVVAVGGDGTLGEVASGLLEDGRASPARAALGLVPLGTGCDFARTLGLRSSEQALERLGRGRAGRIDAGLARLQGRDGQVRERVFLNAAAFGCGGAVSQAIGRRAKLLGGRIGFSLVTAWALLRHRDQRVRVSFDGGPAEELSVTNLAVCNGRYFGGGMQVAPGADPADGALDLTLWQGFGLRDFVLQRRRIYDGTHVRLAGTRTGRLLRLRAESDERVAVDLDGEALGQLPLEIEILPAALELAGWANIAPHP